ncbi:MAG TPA: trypsin-like peptidase domain-containing protein [Acidimicrobiia bacterium]|nr:trypsin-like peptidase domain-containing protein [Acidimicrobiia bacterium]
MIDDVNESQVPTEPSPVNSGESAEESPATTGGSGAAVSQGTTAADDAPAARTEVPSPVATATLPPPAPESPGMPPASLPPAAPRSKRSIWPTLLLALLLVVASSGVTYVLTADDRAGTTAAEDEVPATESAPDFVAGEEPIADVAAVILPSVVQIQTGGGVGSGVIYDADGLILTAAHVVQGSDSVTVRFSDGEEVEGTVLGGTAGADVAVVQVDRTGLTAAELALDTEPRVGQMAIAIGSPWGLQSTVTAGIISAVDQSIPQGGSARAVLQTDAAINPGNSGGPLVDREGRVLGINVSIFSLSGANDGVGFAVPIDVASDIAERVVAGEAIESAFLGVSVRDAESGRAGALITEVTPGTAADQAGIEDDDLVISLDGVQVQSGPDLAAQVQTHRPGTTVQVVLIRDGEQVTLDVTLGERPNDVP